MKNLDEIVVVLRTDREALEVVLFMDLFMYKAIYIYTYIT